MSQAFSFRQAREHSVTVSSIDEVRDHAEELWDAGTSPVHDWDKRADRRSKEKFVTDRIEGKVGEVAFREFLGEFGFDAAVDFDIYESEDVTDFADLKSIDGERPARQFDVKTTKEGNLWLAIRESIYQSHDATDPIVVVQVNTDAVHDPPFEAEVVGWVEKQDLPVRIGRGARLYLPWDDSHEIGPKMKADNWCIPIEDITRRTRGEWREFIESRLVQ